MKRVLDLQLASSELSPERLRELRRGEFRRLDRYGTLVLAAARRLQAELAESLNPETALLMASSFGPQATTFGVLDELLDYPEDQLLAGGFSHSVHNAAASYAAAALGLHGPVLALAGFEELEREAEEFCAALLTAGGAPAAVLILAEEGSRLTELAPELYPGRFPGPVVERVRVRLLLNEV